MWKFTVLSTFFLVGAELNILHQSSYANEYPLNQLSKLDLWKYFSHQNQREKRSMDNQYLTETKLCDSKISFRRPQRLKNINSKWQTIVNHANYTQFVRFEECLSENFPCTYNIYPKPIRSFCQQTTHVVTLLAFNSETNRLSMDKFNVPSSCDCLFIKEDFFSGVSKNLLQP